MLLADYLNSKKDITWDFAVQCGVKYGVIRLPEEDDFDICDFSHWNTVYQKFTDFGIRPIVIEPMPNALHDHIKLGDEKRDECIDKVIGMFSIMERLNIRTICFNFMAHIGWHRTSSEILERGGALVTGFRLADFREIDAEIDEKTLWDNYTYFIKAVLPYAEKHGIQLALHPDDPPLERLGKVCRIMTSPQNISRAMNVVPSRNLGITMCQATFAMMGADLYDTIRQFKDQIFFVHFRNVTGNKWDFRETFHDHGDLDMAALIAYYRRQKIDVPIRVDHVPSMAGEDNGTPGYTALGRLFAIGYLKGLLDADGHYSK